MRNSDWFVKVRKTKFANFQTQKGDNAKNKNLRSKFASVLVLLLAANAAQAYELLPVLKDTYIQKDSVFIKGASPLLKIDSANSQAYLEFAKPSGAILPTTRFNLVLQTQGIRRARNLRAWEITSDWNERSISATKDIGPANSNPVLLPKRGLLKFDVTELVKSQIAAGKTNINLALATERGGLQIMARESGLGAQLEVCNNSIEPIKSPLEGSAFTHFLELSVSVTPPTIVGGALWSTNIVGLTQPGDTILSVKGFGITDNLLPSFAITAQGDLQIGIKNLKPQDVINPSSQNLTFCILR